MRKPFETEVDEAERNRADEDAKNDSNDYGNYETFNTTPHVSSLLDIHDTYTDVGYTYRLVIFWTEQLQYSAACAHRFDSNPG